MPSPCSCNYHFFHHTDASLGLEVLIRTSGIQCSPGWIPKKAPSACSLLTRIMAENKNDQGFSHSDGLIK